MAADEVISCPACRHVVRVPADWLGSQVQCPECKSMFRAPTRLESGELSPSVLLTDRSAPTVRPVSRRTDYLLLLPAFGLMLCGVIGSLVNGLLFMNFVNDPDSAKATIVDQLGKMRGFGAFNDDPPGDAPRKQLDEQRAEEAFPYVRAMYGIFSFTSAFTFLGGLSIVLRRSYSLALLGCVAAAVNLTGFCCVPGLVFGIWALVLLMTPEGRHHFKV